jgi:methionine aminotransferase
MYQQKYNPDSEITVTAGATQAIFTAIATLINPGDEVIIFEPAYDSYRPSVEVFGGKVVPIALKGGDSQIEWQEVTNALTERTKLIMINTPHNPTGSVWQDKDYKQLSKIVKDTDIFILSDEVYESIVFDGLPYKSIAQYPELYDRSFICASFGKLYHNTGWKVGYCLAPKELMNEFQKVHQFNVFSVNHPVQVALSEYMKDPQSYLHLSDLFQRKRDLFLSRMLDSRFTFTPCKGTYFQSMSYDQISDENDVDFAKRLCVEHKISSIPISVFSSVGNKKNMLRFCFAKTDETLIKAAESLCAI